jgi:hypothetical protein
LLIGDAEARGLGLAQLATSCLVDEALAIWGLARDPVRVPHDERARDCRLRRVGFVAQPPVGEVTPMVRRRVETPG